MRHPAVTLLPVLALVAPTTLAVQVRNGQTVMNAAGQCGTLTITNEQCFTTTNST
ncbi:uncharacterized protein DSM5745_03913 [Aspergillus mulundensis]|uniref:Uncharacterized protein n=1 Tax=Aspergillus mulundensis TaxID=1810919 RepID=A0A3D8SB44_9EURO|nr:hypothetical protein DSM5745_03913 [Aspergillus mulundensis]RDW83587.1 hypothetical protein DSM5745_03913 [Aspergillus mulundensis]